MMESNIENKILDLKTNKKFIEMLKETETTKDVQKVFSEFGVDLSEETIDQAAAYVAKQNDELSEDDLEHVSGGFVITTAAFLGITSVLIAVGKATGAWDWWKRKLKVD